MHGAAGETDRLPEKTVAWLGKHRCERGSRTDRTHRNNDRCDEGTAEEARFCSFCRCFLAALRSRRSASVSCCSGIALALARCSRRTSFATFSCWGVQAGGAGHGSSAPDAGSGTDWTGGA